MATELSSPVSVTSQIDGKTLILETGKLANQAHGSVVVTLGETMVLATAVMSSRPRAEDIDFLPLTVDYEERMYSVGKIPGSFFRREGRPGQDGILASRLTDRSIRPLFPKGLHNDIQITLTILSSDMENPPEVLGMIGASAAIGISQIPFNGPIASCRIAYLDGQYIIHPTYEQSTESTLSMVVSSSRDAILMVEAGANEVILALEGGSLGDFEVVGQELVGPVIGQELQQRGINAFVFAMAGILVYIGLRFRFSFAVGAVVAVAHDIAITLSLLTFMGYELSLNVVAAMLTITGYSVNDSIVVFDRVRENLRVMRRDAFADLVNVSVNQTLARTIITSGTTGVAVLALFIFGGEVLEGFAFTMLVGVLSGTYSTIFIAAMIAILITERKAERVRQANVPLASKNEPTPQRLKRRSRKARAS